MIKPEGTIHWISNLSATNNELPFQAYAKRVTALAPQAQIQTSSNSAYFDMPYRTGQVGSDKDHVQLTFGTSVKEKMAVTVRCY